MTARRRDRIVGAASIIVGVLLGSLIILAAFTPVGLVAAPVGIAMIVFGALRLDRASRADA